MTMSGRTFRDDYAVTVCPHVFSESRPINFVVRDTDGSFQFLCGMSDDADAGPCRSVGVGHLLARDSTLGDLAELEPGTYAERDRQTDPWSVGRLDPLEDED
jgi:hypothetical protein